MYESCDVEKGVPCKSINNESSRTRENPTND
jgi:hypothetical protein